MGGAKWGRVGGLGVGSKHRVSPWQPATETAHLEGTKEGGEASRGGESVCTSQCLALWVWVCGAGGREGVRYPWNVPADETVAS